ncbi:MerR family transcriptional regulator [Paenibacillus antri]|uniref:MerR family transcriptional regulator n=1 Tax=Paenibacillus antri TaxID=2582848 RepID=A0A5R9GJN1_9BACL|nr:MerR family transcriptional regulator [Paenibacillus antri]TLS53724.1 MerR family transcriptional regulator [Paenibacillus antri]
MNYSIQEVANRFNLSIHTLRYYDKEGLMPFIGRDPSGNRVFTDSDLNWVAMICCLKDTGMSIKEMKLYADLCVRGMQSIGERKEMLAAHRKQVLQQIEALKKHVELIDSKIEVYDHPELAQQLYGNLDHTSEET